MRYNVKGRGNLATNVSRVTGLLFTLWPPLGLCESSFLLLEYSIEYLIEYSSTRLIPEVATNHRVV